MDINIDELVRSVVPDLNKFFIAVLLVLVIDGILAIIFSVLKKNRGRRIALVLFFSYVGLVCYVTIFSREAGSRAGISFKLFETWGDLMIFHFNFIMNIVLFVPLGMMIPLAWKRGFFLTCLIGLLMSLSIETIQYFTGMGYAQLDDVVTNLTGTIIGALIWKIWDVARRKQRKG